MFSLKDEPTGEIDPDKKRKSKKIPDGHKKKAGKNLTLPTIQSGVMSILTALGLNKYKKKERERARR